MTFLEKLWKFLDGNKTIIGTFLLLLLSKFGAGWFSAQLLEVIIWVIVTLTGASFVHHVSKGKFTTKSN